MRALRQPDARLREALSLAEATLESTADGILVVDRDGRVRSFNRRFAEMWKMPERILASRDDDTLLAFVLKQLKHPKVFLSRVRKLYARPGVESHDSIEFRDGRLFERYSRPQRVGSKIVGRVWSFRDATARRRLEREIAQVSSREQARLGRELHDSVAQTLTAISFLAESVAGSLSSGSREAATIARVAELGKTAIRQVRTLPRGLLPADLESGSLEGALRELSEVASQVYGIACGVSVEGDARIADHAARVELYRIAQEAVLNAAKHARPKTGIQVSFVGGPESLRLVVADDGSGLPAKPGRGLGLAIMRHRAHLLGGTLSILPGKKRGTVVDFECPRPSS